MKEPSLRSQQIEASGIRKFFDLVIGREDVISLGVGEPHFSTPLGIAEAGIEKIRAGVTSYTSNYGLLELREEVAAYLLRRFGVKYDPRAEILLTCGVSQGYDLAIRALVDPGDEVVYAEPCYVMYRPAITLSHGIPVAVETEMADGFRLQPEALRGKIKDKTTILVLSYPSNPTGSTFSREDLENVAQLAEKEDLLVVSDEVYCELTYEGDHCCFASLPGMRERTILLNGFSKAYAMTGWRLGYIAAPAPYIEAMVKIHQSTMICPPVMAQYAGIEALRNGEEAMRGMVSEYDRRRHLIYDRLAEMGLPCAKPEGAFYIFPSVAHLGVSSQEFSERLLKEESVAVVPGGAFGKCGEGFIRSTYCAAPDVLNEALNRMERFVRRLEQA